MYHPSRGGVRGGRDQFKWDDVKVDKHRENYLGHSIMAPVGRWQKGKDLHWYGRDKKSQSDMDAAKAEIQKIKEEEEQAMREALGLAPKRASRPQGNRLDKHEYEELVKKGSTAEDLGEGHAEAAQVQGLGFSRAPRTWQESSSVAPSRLEVSSAPAKEVLPKPPPVRSSVEEGSDGEDRKKKRKHEHKKKPEKREKRHSRDSEDKKRHKKHKEKRRHDSDSD
ncbi:hypothetical protein Scep_015212 [Stephania cephalantha]|uniref:Multiple myeloma tumor-associated protein 2-like N-terminal domain-containing protein n=1 Tax=Stephania cephalantha TaxID=152367 RepID=A0AAP0J2L1_9MAGN